MVIITCKIVKYINYLISYKRIETACRLVKDKKLGIMG